MEETYRKVLGLDDPWPLKDVLDKLIFATEYLLHRNNYDGHNHEELQRCVSRGKEIIGYLQPVTAKTEQETEITEKFPDTSENAKQYNKTEQEIIKALSGEKIEDVKTVTSTDYEQPERVSAEEWLMNHKDKDLIIDIFNIEYLSNLLTEFASQHPVEQEKLSEQSVDMPCAYEFLNQKTGHCYVDYIHRSDLEHDGEYIETPLYYHSQKHLPTDDMIVKALKKAFKDGHISIHSTY